MREGALVEQRSRNDVSWYSRNPLLLRAAASIPFPYRPGMNIPWMLPNDTVNTLNRTNIPGIFTINWYPTVGKSTTATDPASIVGKEIFAKVREKFSGSIDADAPDFVIYLMALDSVYSYIASLKRVYRILVAYTSENHYIPDALLQALGFTTGQIVDLKEHRMQFFQIINELVFMTRKFNIPAAFDIINRHYWLNDNVYMDADSINSQFYVFNCLGYYKFGMQEISTGVSVGSLSLSTLTIPNTGVAEYLYSFGRSLIDALAGSDDAYIISGYLMRAYEGFPTFTVDELPLEDKLVPHYDPEVLMQIENATPIQVKTFGNADATLTNGVTQDPATNAVVCTPHLKATRPAEMLGVVWDMENTISIRSDEPSVADVTIATRLKMGVENDKGTTTNVDYDIVCGSEIVDSFKISYYWLNNSGTRNLQNAFLQGPIFVAASNIAYVVGLTMMQSFDWHPIIPTIIVVDPSPTSLQVYTALSGDLHNTALLSNEQLKQINRVCLYSEFNAYGQI